MPTLQVRELPEDVYRRLQTLAESENRSLAQETIVLLRKALKMESTNRQRRKEIIDSLNLVDALNTKDFPSPEKLIREDRDQ